MSFLVILMLLGAAVVSSRAQEPVRGADVASTDQDTVRSGTVPTLVASIFHSIEESLGRSEIGGIPSRFSAQVYLSLPGHDEGYYSANQGSAILLEFFKSKKVAAFRFSETGGDGGTWYASGRGTIVSRGLRSSLQVYISLTKQENVWLISQFTIF